MSASGLAAYVGYLFVALAAVNWSATAPLTRDIETEASRYTYHVGRSLFSMLIGFGVIQGLGVSALGQPGNRKWFVLVGAAQWFFLWGYVKAMESLDSTTWAVVHFCTYPVFATFIGQLINPMMLDPEQDDVKWGYFAYQIIRNAVTIWLMCMDMDFSVLLEGGGWCLLTATASGVGSAVLRAVRKTDSSLTVVLWADVINLILWLPPGVFDVRVPFLWPLESEHTNLALQTSWNFSWHVWACLVLCGIAGFSGMQCIGLAMQTLPVGVVTAFVAPLTILLSLTFDAILGVKEIRAMHLVGAGLFLTCIVVEAFLGCFQSAEESANPDEAGLPLTAREGQPDQAYGSTDELKAS